METATSKELDYLADDEELKRFCVVFGVMQSNTMYRILSAKDKAEMMERITGETKGFKLNSRGAEKCADGQVWDEAQQKCV